MGEDVLIRDFKKSDLDDVLEVGNKSFAQEIEIGGFDPNHARRMADQAFGVLGRIFFGFLRLLGKDPFKFFVAEVGGKVVGTAMLNTKGNMGYISIVMVHPVYRRKGIATRLMKTAINHIRKKKLSRAILHVVSTNAPAEGLYYELGFKKFEDTVYLVADIDSLRKPDNVEGIQIRNFKKKDIAAVYNLIKCSEDPTHLKVFDFKKKDLKTPLIQHVFHFSTDEEIVAVKDGEIVGYTEASYTTAKETGHIRNVQVHPEMRSEGIEKMLISVGVGYIRKVGTNKVMATTLSTRQKLIENMKQLGFEKYLEMEAMVLQL